VFRPAFGLSWIATTRLGIFQTVLDSIADYKKANYTGDKSRLNLGDRIVSGMTAGALGSLCGVPADLSLVRFLEAA
jgi:hypothetical protein